MAELKWTIDNKCGFRRIEKYPDYFIHPDGTLYSIRVRKLKPNFATEYPSFGFRNSRGCRIMKSLHLLLLETFVGPRPPNQICRHLDGNCLNFSLNNLAWGTQAENSLDSWRHATMVHGELTNTAKVDRAKVKKIRSEHKDGKSINSIARKFGISWKQTKRIISRVSWRWIK